MNINQQKIESFLSRLEQCNSLSSLHHLQSYFCGMMDMCPDGVDSAAVIERFFKIRDRREAELKGKKK